MPLVLLLLYLLLLHTLSSPVYCVIILSFKVLFIWKKTEKSNSLYWIFYIHIHLFAIHSALHFFLCIQVSTWFNVLPAWRACFSISCSVGLLATFSLNLNLFLKICFFIIWLLPKPSLLPWFSTVWLWYAYIVFFVSILLHVHSYSLHSYSHSGTPWYVTQTTGGVPQVSDSQFIYFYLFCPFLLTHSIFTHFWGVCDILIHAYDA